MRGAGETRVKIAKIQRYINTYLNNPPLNHGEFDDTHWIPRNLRVRSVKGFLSYTTLETKFWTYCNRLENNCHMVEKKNYFEKRKTNIVEWGPRRACLRDVLVSCSRKVSVDSVQRYDSLQAILVLKDI